MSRKSPFGSAFRGASHLENIGSWKAGSPASTVAKSSIWTMMDYDYDYALHTSRELQARWRKILNLRLKPNVLPSCIPKRNGRNGCLQQTCRANLLSEVRQFREHGQLKGWQPRFQTTVAKSSISTTVRWFAAVSSHNWEHDHCIVTTLGNRNSVTKPSASLHETGFFLPMQRRDGHDATMMESWWSVLPLSGTSNFTKGMDSFDKHVAQTSFRQCTTFSEHGQRKGC